MSCYSVSFSFEDKTASASIISFTYYFDCSVLNFRFTTMSVSDLFNKDGPSAPTMHYNRSAPHNLIQNTINQLNSPSTD
jgi:hypothetical protein